MIEKIILQILEKGTYILETILLIAFILIKLVIPILVVVALILLIKKLAKKG